MNPHLFRTASLAAGRWVHRTSYLKKWLVLGVLIGVIAGLGVVLLYTAITLGSRLFLQELGGYKVPTTFASGSSLGSPHFTRPWAIPLVVGFGGLLSGLLVFHLAPEARGDGVDAGIDAVHHNPRGIRIRAVIVKIVASALTIGSGGSAGREGPTAQVSAGFGSYLARLFDLSPEDGRIAVSIGIGSGIGAIFGAPLGGAVFGADIPYRDDFEIEALIPGLVASVIAYTVFGLIETFTPIFGFPSAGFRFHQPIQLAWFAVIGVLAGGIGLLYSKSFYGVTDYFDKMKLHRALRPALGGLLVGTLALALPEVLGTGYGWIQVALGSHLLGIPLWAVLLVPFARILATALSIGSGGSGGTFAPGLVTGAFVGAAVWRVLEPIAPGIPRDPAPFVIVGMMACFGSISRAPLAIMLMVAEMTGSIAILAPAMVAVGFAYLIVRAGNDTIYRSQPRNRDTSSAQRLAAGVPLSGSLDVRRAMQPPRLVLGAAVTVANGYPVLRDAGVPGAPVVDHGGRLIGTVSIEELEQARSDPSRRDLPIANLADRTAPTITASASLGTAIEAITSAGGWATVITGNREVAGIVSTGDVMRSATTALRSNLDQLAQVASGSTTVELEVGEGCHVLDRPLSAGVLPPGCVVVSILRSHSLHFADGETVLKPGDQLTILAQRDQVARLKDLLASPTGTSTPPTTDLLAVPTTTSNRAEREPSSEPTDDPPSADPGDQAAS